MEDTQARKLAADAEFENFEFDEGCEPEEINGWESDGFDVWTRVIFIRSENSGDTERAVFSVEFEPGSDVVASVWADCDGNSIGRRAAVSSSPAPSI